MEEFLPKTSISSLKQTSFRTTLRYVRAQGHPYVELREEGKHLFYFCILCLSPCSSDSCLFDHLNGRLHTARLATAQVTLLKPNPWPFNDGMLFFHLHMEEQSKNLPASHSGKIKLEDVGPVASTQRSQKSEDNADCKEKSSSSTLDGDQTGGILVIPGIRQNCKPSDLVVRHIGVGKIGSRFKEKDGVSSEICKIWCEWLGNVDTTTEDVEGTPKHDFAIVTFSYYHKLGRLDLIDVFLAEAKDSGPSRGKKRKFSETKDISEALRNQDHSSGEKSQSSKSSKSKVLFSRYGDKLARILSSKTTRKQLRKQYCIFFERDCDICQQKLLPDKDVATLLNRKTGKLMCSSRNFNGVFHVFHISCLIQWILLFEVEVGFAEQSDIKKAKAMNGQKNKQICSALCPQCQATGIITDRGGFEPAIVSLSQMYNYKIKLGDARRAWIKSPEMLDNCSLGLYFPQQHDEIYQEIVAPLKMLHFYRADQ
ncbi:hypothetical protein AAHA92_05291 [Salvia divinorum]|uniref:C2H2-type domain-containing protein n=1 Tax=Salvia divinorum TaxID=28513 RepID=A0ABD1I5F9_SALDI